MIKGIIKSVVVKSQIDNVVLKVIAHKEKLEIVVLDPYGSPCILNTFSDSNIQVISTIDSLSMDLPGNEDAVILKDEEKEILSTVKVYLDKLLPIIKGLSSSDPDRPLIISKPSYLQTLLQQGIMDIQEINTIAVKEVIRRINDFGMKKLKEAGIILENYTDE